MALHTAKSLYQLSTHTVLRHLASKFKEIPKLKGIKKTIQDWLQHMN